MKKALQLMIAVLMVFLGTSADAQEVKASKAKSWSLSGRVQLQHVYNTSVDSDASRTNNGFRVRRTRIQTKAKFTEYVSAKIQFDIRDNSPRLKDAEGKIKLFNKKAALRFGQFKAPVWREEFKRSSGSLMLVERSAAAEFLADSYLSARHVGVELNAELGESFSAAINYSNGAGEGFREDGRGKSETINNGKMIAARLDGKFGKTLQVGVSYASNTLGTNEAGMDETGPATVIAPDFGVYLGNGLDIEGGLAIGSFDQMLTGSAEDISFMVYDVTAQWKSKLATPSDALGGMDAIGLALGFSGIDGNTDVDDNEATVLRFGPVFYFGKRTRLQINGESTSFSAEGVDSDFTIRSQFTVNL